MALDLTDIITTAITSATSIVVALITHRSAKRNAQQGDQAPNKPKNKGKSRRLVSFGLIGGALGLLGSMLLRDRAQIIPPGTIADGKLELDTARSGVDLRTGVIGRPHDLTVPITRGEFKIKDGVLSGSAELAMDRLPVALGDTGTNEHLIGHLASPDFFNVDSFPRATLEILEVQDGVALGAFTMKGKRHVTRMKDFKLMSDSTIGMVGTLTLARSELGLIYPGPKELLLDDSLSIGIQLNFYFH